MEELIQKGEEAKAFLVQMNIDKEQMDAQMEKENPWRLSAVKGKRRGKVEESGGESFDEVPPGSDESESETLEIIVSVQGLNTIRFSS